MNIFHSLNMFHNLVVTAAEKPYLGQEHEPVESKSMGDVVELGEIKDAVERSLPPDVIAMLRNAGLRLTLGSSEATIPSPSIVAIDQGLVEQLAQEEELTADMVSYRKDVTGLDNTVFISVRFPRHGPRIKVAIDPPTHINQFGNNASVSIDDGRVVAGHLSARELVQVQRFIDLNRDVLLDYWENRIDTKQLGERLRPVPEKGMPEGR